MYSRFLRVVLVVWVSIFLLYGCPGSDKKTSTSESETPAEVQKFVNADPNKEDTDGDGLTDDFEINKSYPFHKPNLADTDSNGINDADEDIDEDGLTALQEQNYETSPVTSDTDQDGLSDYDEIFIYNTDPNVIDTDQDNLTDREETLLGTDPNLSDTDNNGISDDQENFISEVTSQYSDIQISVEGRGYLANNINIKQISNSHPELSQALGQISESYDISFNENTDSSDLKSAQIALKFDTNDSNITDPYNLEIFTFDESQHFWIPAGYNTSVDVVNGIVTATVDHFSAYALFDRRAWENNWKQIKNVCWDILSSEKPQSDVAFVIDSSGSMEDNDPDNLRFTSAVKFLDSFGTGDRGAVIDFDKNAEIFQSFTSDKSLLTKGFELIDSDGGTNIGAGIEAAYAEFTNNSSFSRNRIIILLTDGDGDYDEELTTTLKEDGIRVLVIGLGDEIDETLLKSIAEGTNGLYKKINSADELPDTFSELTTVMGDTGADTDEDGLSDCQEIQGFRTLTGKLIQTDPNKEDTDEDGLLDGEEVGPEQKLTEIEIKNTGEVLNLGESSIRPIYSDPTQKDSDNDDLDDTEDPYPLIKDFDGDSLSDGEELSYNTDIENRDTDGDRLSYRKVHPTVRVYLDDGFEVRHPDYDPLSYDVVYSKDYYTQEFNKGYIWGSIKDIETTPQLFGSIIRGYTPGVGLAFDAMDSGAELAKGEYFSASLSLLSVTGGLGYIAGPPAGAGTEALASTPKAINAIVKSINKLNKRFNKFKYLKRVVAKPTKAIQELLPEGFEFADDIIIGVVKKVWLKEYNALKEFGFTDKLLAKLIKESGTDLEALATMVKKAKKIELPVKSKYIDPSKYTDASFKEGFFYGQDGWRLAEDYMRKGTPKPKGLNTSIGKNVKERKRFPDVYDEISKIAKEIKTGFQRLTPSLKKQIKKDAELLQKKVYKKIEWHFFPSGRSGSIGADPKLIAELDKYKIPYFIHLP